MRNLCRKSYLKLFQELCVSDTLRWSRDLYDEHITDVRQYDPAAFPTSQFQHRPEEPDSPETVRNAGEIDVPAMGIHRPRREA
ncbi:hypothetical protein AVEN_55583-1 [Araneus ventricosus]|uniref:Uncharacterized protein n=1 Tax=Araneus ventricosus TaxID=182803 RepID=A0A4Y2SDP7_ARAVE|nr:hypothetical protein AVEN_55583-1 [Araneus ventricosus]